jgi:hypothetical protein
MGGDEGAGSDSDKGSRHLLTSSAPAALLSEVTGQASTGRMLQAAANKEGAGVLAYAEVQDTVQRSWHEVVAVLEPARSCSHTELVVQLKGPGEAGG